MSKYPIPFGRHLLLERVNVGGMAEVFKAKAFGVEGFERVVAVKRILPTLVSDQEFITMFIDEARIAANLTHQNIVQIYELGKHDETYFISMEYIAGKDLRQILDFQKKLGVPMAVPKACFIVSRVCEALEYAHRKKDPAGRDLKIIHRDVTPQNVIISYEGEVKLCDFGIAKAASRVSRTQVGVLKGKFAYMSPEQVRGQPTDRRSDLFALGVIFYEMLTGERLFLSDSDYSTLEAVRNAVIPPPSQHNEQISPELETVMLKLLSADPRTRYQWASDVHEELLDHLVQSNRLYHGRHLRQGMQDTYGRDIEIENAKLEAFMRLKLPAAAAEEPEPPAPKPSDVVVALAEEGQVVARDPANNHVYEPPYDHDDDLGGPTDSIAIPDGPFTADDETESSASISNAGAPTLAGLSPVANLFGAPELETDGDAEDAALTDGDMVVVAAGIPLQPELRDAPTDEQDIVGPELVERTHFDALDGIPNNDTLFDEMNETVMGDAGPKSEISAAQAALINRLDEVGGFGEDGETVDAGDVSQEIVAPQVLDPAESEEEAPTFLGEHGIAELPDFDEVDDGATSVSPLILDDIPPHDALFAGGAPEVFESDDGTLEDAEAFVPTFAGTEDDTSDIDPAAIATARNGSDADRVAGKEPIRPRRLRGWQGDDGSTRPPSPPPGFRGPGYEAPSPRPFVPDVAAVEAPPVEAPQAGVRVGTHVIAGPRLLMILAGGVGLLAAVLLGVVVLLLRPGTASLQIVTEPTRAVEVRLDGEPVAQETPVEIDDIAIGSHHVELRAEGFRPYRQTIQIVEAKPHTMVVPLERSVARPARPKAPIADDSEAPLPEDMPLPSGDAPPPATADDVAAPTTDTRADHTPPPPVVAPPPPVVAPPPPVVAPPPKAVVVRAPPPPRRALSGTLMVSTRPPGLQVKINGKDTGLRTPIRKPYRLPAGQHVITFVMTSGKTYDFDIEIEAGKTNKLVKLLR